MKRFLNVSLQTKVLVLIISLILLVLILLTSIFAFLESKETKSDKEQLALQTAMTVSLMPAIKQAFRSDNPSKIIQPIAEQVREQVGVASVIVANREGTIFSHPSPEKLGTKMKGDDNYKALVFGGHYSTLVKGNLGKAIRGKAPVYLNYGSYRKVVGVVTVGFLVKDIEAAITKKVINRSLFSFLVLVIGAFGGVMLTKSIKKDTFGLEPYEIASLYRERNAVLLSIKEGVIAIDEKGLITMLNKSAQDMLNLGKDVVREPIEDVLPATKMPQVLKSGVAENDKEMAVGAKRLITNRTPVVENGRIVGVVSSFRDKTEIQDMVDTLSEVKKYSEDLRSQTHEFNNKLHVLSGLLQLGNFNEAIEMIQEESRVHSHQNQIVFEQIKDSKVQAILLGKISKASEKKINFIVDKNSSLQPLPNHIKTSQLVTVIGNIIDNAFEAVETATISSNRQVSFFTFDMGNDVLFEVTDMGQGFKEGIADVIFEKGFSEKHGKHRGFGLSNVKEIVEELDGVIEAGNHEPSGAIISVFIPKQLKEVTP